MPVHDPVQAGEELQRAADLGGLRGGELYVSGTTKPIYLRDGHWDPLWRASAETHMPISFHIGGGGIQVPGPIDGQDAKASHHSLNPTQNELGVRRTYRFS